MQNYSRNVRVLFRFALQIGQIFPHPLIRLPILRRAHAFASKEDQIKIFPTRKTAFLSHLIHREVRHIFPLPNRLITTLTVNPITKRQTKLLIDILREGRSIRTDKIR